MAIHSKRNREVFDPSEIVMLKQMCLTANGQIFQPGKYLVHDLPDIAFEMGLVDQLPSVKGKSAEIKNPETPPENNS